MKRSLPLVVAMVLVAGGALAFRLPKLTVRAMHVDEAVHAVKFQELAERGRYVYDPHEYHGPTLYYAALPVYWLSSAKNFAGTTEATYRLVPVIFGAALVLLHLLLVRGLGGPAALCAAILTAVSHAMVYYSRYYIQETLFVFFTFAMLAAGYRYARSGKVAWAVAAGVSAGLMHATKETCVIAFGAMGVALAVVMLWRKRAGAARPGGQFRVAHLAAALAAGAVVSAVAYSGGFTNSRGPLDSILTYLQYFQRAGAGGIHEHPWTFYLQTYAWNHFGRLTWSEGLVFVLAAAGLAFALAGRGLGDADAWLARFLAVYAVVSTAAYTAVPYKTPWSFLGTFHGMILLAGLGAVGVVRAVPTVPLKVLLGLLLAGATAQLARQSYLGNYRYYDDPRNPYVYAHTSRDFLRLPRRLEQIAAADPAGREMIVKIISADADYWPLPWHLRTFNPRHVGYYDAVPDKLDDATMVIATANLSEPGGTAAADAVETKLGEAYIREHYALRPGGVLLAVFIRRSVWEEFLKTRTGTRPAGG